MKILLVPSKKKARQSHPAFDLVLWSDNENVVVPVHKPVAGFVVDIRGADKYDLDKRFVNWAA